MSKSLKQVNNIVLPSIRQSRMMMQNNVQSLVNQFCQKIAEEAFNAVLIDFPAKIRSLEELKKYFDIEKLMHLETKTNWVHHSFKSFIDRKQIDNISSNNNSDNSNNNNSNNNNYINNHQSLGAYIPCIQDSSKKPLLFDSYERRYFDSKNDNQSSDGNAMISTNETIHSLIQRIKPFIIELIEQTDQLFFAIQILMPKIQEGNNFGVEVQLKGLNLIQSFNQRLSIIYQDLSTYYYKRQQSIQLMTLHPQIEDYQQYLKTLDFSYINNLCQYIDYFYGAYTIIHDFIIKNIDFLLNPRDDNSMLIP